MTGKMKRLIKELNTPIVRKNYNPDNDSVNTNDDVNVPILVQLFNKVLRMEKNESSAKREVIRSWYEFSEEFERQVEEKLSKHRTKKNATSKVYNELMKRIPITRLNLRKRVEKTNKVYRLFEGVGVKKIEKINITTANEISNFSQEQIDLIISNVSSN
jgi:hypothetical protein